MIASLEKVDRVRLPVFAYTYLNMRVLFNASSGVVCSRKVLLRMVPVPC